MITAMSRKSLHRRGAAQLLVLSLIAQLALATIPAAPAAAVDPGDIPASVLPPAGWKDTQWVNPGGFVNVDVSSFGLPANAPTVDSSVLIENYLATASGRVVLVFQPGVYYFHSTLTITRSDVILRGAGSDATSFVIGSLDARDAQLEFSGGESGAAIAVPGAVSAGAQQLALADAGTIAVGDVIQLRADAGRIAFGYPVESQFFTVTAKSGNTLTLDMKVGLDYPAANAPVVQRINAIRNVGVDLVRIVRSVQPASENVSNLLIRHAYNVFTKNIESVMGGRGHITVHWSKDVVIAGNKVHDAFKNNAGDGGYGYGISVNWGSTGVRISDNKVWDLRHMIILQLGANHTVTSYNALEYPFTDYNDLALHATYAYLNLFEGNRFKEGYADNSKTGTMSATGPGNTWFRNYADEEVGSINNDTTRQNVIGNVVGSIVSAGSGHLIGANRVAGTARWGALPVNPDLPPSLYRNSAPSFWPTGKPWPVWGPDQPSWGTGRTLPAQDRSRPTTTVYTDHLSDWSRTASHSNALTFGTSNAQYFGGDTSRVTRTTTGSAEVVWRVPNLISALVTAYFWPGATPAPFTFQTSADEGATWQTVGPLIDTTGGNWLKYTYVVTGGGTADYLKVVFPAISPDFAAQISSVQFVVP
jgi:hypothetical protein